MTAAEPVSVSGFDHLVLRVEDPERSARWYEATLGLEILRLDEWRAGEVPFVSVRIDATTIIDLMTRSGEDIPGADSDFDHLALVVDDDLDELAERLPIIRGPLRLFGAQGYGRGVYLEDPDGIVVELRSYADPA